MKRFSLLLFIITFFSACGSQKSSTSGSDTLPRIKWRLASSYPTALDTIFGASDTLAEKVDKLSNGRFTIRVFPAGELVPGLEVMDAVQQGTVDIGHTASYYYIGKDPALVFDTSVPFGMTARQQSAWMFHGGGIELMQEVFDPFNIIMLPGGNTGTQMGGWFRKPIQSFDDIKGLKMRIPGVGGKIMSRMGANVQVLSGGDIYPALDRGAIDATEWVGPYDDEKLGFHQVAKFYHYPGWWEPGPQLSFYISKDSWNSLPDHYKEILKTAAKEAHYDMLSRYDAQNPEALSRLEKNGVTLSPFPRDVLTQAEKETESFLEEEAAKSESFNKVYRSWKEFKDKIVRWHGLSEYHYSKYLYEEKK